jgi:hypothetical protein
MMSSYPTPEPSGNRRSLPNRRPRLSFELGDVVDRLLLQEGVDA